MSPDKQRASLINPDGSINKEVGRREFGLDRELNQRVRWGDYSGTVAEMLNDRRCPVGDMIRKAHNSPDGIDAVARQFKALSMMDPNFKLEISPETRALPESQKKKGFGPFRR